MLSTPIDPFLRVAFLAGVVAQVMTALLVILIVAMRISLNRRQRRELQFTSHWRPVLMVALVDPEDCELPALPARDSISFLKLWNYLQESVRGEATDNLNQVARRLDCGALAKRLLRKGNRAERLLAILTLGNLRERESWADLLSTAKSPDKVTSFNAARALVKIDPMSGVAQLMPLVLARQDWEISLAARMLGDARAALRLFLNQGIDQLLVPELLRLLQILEALRVPMPNASWQLLLKPEQAPAVLAAALRIAAADADLLDSVREHLDHPDWRVRSEAVRCLGRLAEPSDLPLLSGRLHDAEWWVRYHAAQALASLPFLGRDGFAALQSTVTDAAARQILAQVSAERNLSSLSN